MSIFTSTRRMSAKEQMAFELGASSMRERAAQCCDRVAQPSDKACATMGDIGTGQIIAGTILAGAIRKLPIWDEAA
jgi:hypothetical protein